MKHLIQYAFAMVLLAGTAIADGETLIRSQWTQKIGDAAQSGEALRETLSQVAPEDATAFVQATLKAVAALPAGGEDKGAAFVRTAVAAIASAPKGTKNDVIAEVFADTPVEYLPVLVEELSKRFSQQLNNLDDAAYEKIASEVIDTAEKRNASTDEPSVRNASVVLCFLRGAKSPDELKNTLIAQLDDERQRNLASGWADQVLKDGDYSSLTAAASAEPENVSSVAISNAMGTYGTDRLLAALNDAQNVADANANPESDDASTDTVAVANSLADIIALPTTPSDDAFGDITQVGTGFDRTPIVVGEITIARGYQNQTLSVVGYDGTSTKHRGRAL